MTIRKVVVVIYTVVISANVYSSSIPLTSLKKESVINALESYIVERKKTPQRNFEQDSQAELKATIPFCDLQDLECQYQMERIEKLEKLEKTILENEAKERYPVSIVYLNDSNFPYEYYESEPYNKDMSEAEKLAYEEKVYTYYLGGDYEQLQPSLSTISDDYLILDMYITSSELQFYSSDNRITAIHTPANRSQEERRTSID